VIDDALAASSETAAHGLLAFRAVQLASAARPAEAVTIGESIDRPELAALPALILAWARTIALGDLGRPLEAATVAAEGVALAATSPEAAYQAVPLAIFHVQALVLGGYIRQARTVAERTLQQCADAPGITLATATAIDGVAALANGELHSALERLRSAVAEFDLYQPTTGVDCGFRVAYTEALARAGDIDAARQALIQMQRGRHPAHAFEESDTVLATAWVAAARGRTSQACALAARAAEFACAHGQYAREVLCRQAAIQFGDHQQARRLAELANLIEGPRAGLAARWANALAHDDGDALLEVSRDLEAMGDRIAAADAAAQASLTFHRHARRGSALTAAGRAGRIISDCGSTTPATRAAAAPLPLTERQREIATLISDGLSNKEIAEALAVSVRTVEGHIYQACINVSVGNRTELGRLLAEFRSDRPAGHDRLDQLREI
jgi:DNA-binding NarL/FixJ family response regulator